jgi:phosphoribosylformylglycinamidine (FGAM) synthase-like amidotransferase family enzyme
VTEPRPRVGVVVFPGSNDDRDAAWALSAIGAEPQLVWHADPELPEVDAVVLPGGFSYGDYLRAGAIARFAPAMDAVGAFAGEGGPVLGICNGFQILCEAGLLPGVLRPNTSLSFVCKDVSKHGDGCYQAPADLPPEQVVLRYAEGENPNGSDDDIAGVVNADGNVLGLMPHPEHAVDALLGSGDGALILASLVDVARERSYARA